MLTVYRCRIGTVFPILNYFSIYAQLSFYAIFQKEISLLNKNISIGDVCLLISWWKKKASNILFFNHVVAQVIFRQLVIVIVNHNSIIIHTYIVLVHIILFFFSNLQLAM